MKKSLVLLMLFSLCLNIKAQNKIIEVDPSSGFATDQSIGRFIKRKVAIGRFSNETQYAKGLFYDRENDPMAKQALDILSAKLASSGKFLLLERNDLDKIESELKRNAVEGSSIGADYLIVGSITAYGRKNVGDVRVFSTTKTQIVEAGVSIRIVDVSTGLIIYSDEAKGEAETKSKTTLGVGGKADYDATLSDKAISAAISQLVENVINKCTDKPWRSYLLSYDEEGIVISGGASQDIRVGDIFAVKKKGKKVTNPQNGLRYRLEGKTVGKVCVKSVGGQTPETEYAYVSYSGQDIDKNQLDNYYIEEIKE